MTHTSVYKEERVCLGNIPRVRRRGRQRARACLQNQSLESAVVLRVSCRVESPESAVGLRVWGC